MNHDEGKEFGWRCNEYLEGSLIYRMDNAGNILIGEPT